MLKPVDKSLIYEIMYFMEENDDWLSYEYFKYYRKDIFIFWRKANILLWKLFKITKSKRLALFIGDLQITQAEMIKKDWEEENTPYNEILDDCYREIIEVIINNKLCDPLENVKIKNIRGFDFFNAMAFPCFGDNLLAINTGVFFLSHTLVRSTEALLKARNENTKLPKIFEKLFLKQFIKASLAIICRDHTKTIFKIRFIASDDSLLTGIEIFCIAHEYAHLIFRKINYEYTMLKFEKYYDADIVKLIFTNQEIAADAFAIIVLKYYQLSLNEYSIALYSPQFLFKIFANYDEILSTKESKTHPANIDRYNYIKKMVCQSKYDIYDSELDIIWEKSKININKYVNKYKKYYNKIMSIWNEILAIIREDIESNKMH